MKKKLKIASALGIALILSVALLSVQNLASAAVEAPDCTLIFEEELCYVAEDAPYVAETADTLLQDVAEPSRDFCGGITGERANEIAASLTAHGYTVEFNQGFMMVTTPQINLWTGNPGDATPSIDEAIALSATLANDCSNRLDSLITEFEASRR
jgi:hypothetical protein